MRHIVKRGGHLENFDERKLYASVYAAALAARVTDAEAELLAQNTAKHIVNWIETRQEVNSGELQEAAYDFLKEYLPNAAYLYRHHKDLG